MKLVKNFFVACFLTTAFLASVSSADDATTTTTTEDDVGETTTLASTLAETPNVRGKNEADNSDNGHADDDDDPANPCKNNPCGNGICKLDQENRLDPVCSDLFRLQLAPLTLQLNHYFTALIGIG